MGLVESFLQVARDSWHINRKRYWGDFVGMLGFFAITDFLFVWQKLESQNLSITTMQIFFEVLFVFGTAALLTSLFALYPSILLVLGHAREYDRTFNEYVASEIYHEYTRSKLKREDAPIRWFGDRDDPSLPLSSFRRIDQLCRELRKTDLKGCLAPLTIMVWLPSTLFSIPILIGLFTFYQLNSMWFLHLIVTILVIFFLGGMIYGLRSSKLILTNSLIHSRNFYFAKEVAISNIVSAKISDNHLFLNVCDGSKNRDVRLNLGLYDPKECEQLVGVLNSLMEQKVSTSSR